MTMKVNGERFEEPSPENWELTEDYNERFEKAAAMGERLAEQISEFMEGQRQLLTDAVADHLNEELAGFVKGGEVNIILDAEFTDPNDVDMTHISFDIAKENLGRFAPVWTFSYRELVRASLKDGGKAYVRGSLDALASQLRELADEIERTR